MKISIAVEQPVDNIEIAKFIRKITKCSLSTAKKQLKMGEKGFFYTTELFLNDFPERAEEILSLIKYFRDLNIGLYIIEIEYNESWKDINLNNLKEYRIEDYILKNIVLESKNDFL